MIAFWLVHQLRADLSFAGPYVKTPDHCQNASKYAFSFDPTRDLAVIFTSFRSY
jgi:hypothetical protein